MAASGPVVPRVVRQPERRARFLRLSSHIVADVRHLSTKLLLSLGHGADVAPQLLGNDSEVALDLLNALAIHLDHQGTIGSLAFQRAPERSSTR
jgi:hypothetical protein